MHHGLFWKLFWTIAAGTVSLFWAVDILTQRTEQHMSYIDEVYQQQLLDYGAEAEHIYHSQGEQQLAQWLRHLQDREQTWAAVTPYWQMDFWLSPQKELIIQVQLQR